MIKLISKYLAKRWVEKHKDEYVILSVTDTSIKALDLYQDMTMYILLYGFLMFLWVIGVPVGVLYLSDYSVLWTILTLLFTILSGLILTISIVIGIAKNISSEIFNLVNKLRYEKEMKS